MDDPCRKLPLKQLWAVATWITISKSVSKKKLKCCNGNLVIPIFAWFILRILITFLKHKNRKFSIKTSNLNDDHGHYFYMNSMHAAKMSLYIKSGSDLNLIIRFSLLFDIFLWSLCSFRFQNKNISWTFLKFEPLNLSVKLTHNFVRDSNISSLNFWLFL